MLADAGGRGERQRMMVADDVCDAGCQRMMMAGGRG